MKQAQRILENVIHLTNNPDSDQFRQNLGASVREMIAMDEIAFVCPLTGVHGKTTYSLMHIDSALSRHGKTSLQALVNQGDGFLDKSSLEQMIESGHLLKKHKESVITFLPVICKGRLVEIIIVRADSMPSESLFLLKGYARLYRNFFNLILEGQTDGLTGLLNRKAMEARLKKVVDETQAVPPGAQLTPGENQRTQSTTLKPYLAVVDIDHFKKINDTKGHLFGDEVIILVARLMEELFRSNDLIFRFGGEEFVVVLFAEDCDGARAALERFRQRIANHPFPQLDSITVSIGFVEIRKGISTTALIGQADQALYYAKEHGRNQVSEYEALMRSGELKLVENKQDVEFF